MAMKIPREDFPSIKKLIEIHSISIGNDTLQAIRLIKGYIMGKGGYINISPLSPLILKAAGKSHSSFLVHTKTDGRERERRYQKSN